MGSKLLSIYLNDHLAGAIGGLELCRRAARNNRGNELGGFLQELAGEIEEDLHALERVMHSAGASRDPIKTSVAWAAEKVGRLKLNGSLLGYSPLSRLEELEGVALGVDGKLSLWRTVERTGHGGGEDLDRLIRRAESQRSRLERHRLRAAQMAFGAGGRPRSGRAKRP